MFKDNLISFSFHRLADFWMISTFLWFQLAFLFSSVYQCLPWSPGDNSIINCCIRLGVAKSHKYRGCLRVKMSQKKNTESWFGCFLGVNDFATLIRFNLPQSSYSSCLLFFHGWSLCSSPILDSWGSRQAPLESNIAMVLLQHCPFS